MLHKITEFLEENNITYRLEIGTMLGVIREKKLLPWDNDIDISIKEEEVNKLAPLLYKLWLKGFKTRIARHKRAEHPFVKGNVQIIKIFNALVGSIMLEIFVKTRYEAHYYWAVGKKISQKNDLLLIFPTILPR